jgi:hypothetical protein
MFLYLNIVTIQECISVLGIPKKSALDALRLAYAVAYNLYYLFALPRYNQPKRQVISRKNKNIGLLGKPKQSFSKNFLLILLKKR